MPKKFKGENSKAAVARARKEEERLKINEQKQKEIEDEYWRDDDKHALKKQQRKENKEKKRLDDLQRKKDREELLEQETTSLKSAKLTSSSKVTRAQIQANIKEQQGGDSARSEPRLVDEIPLEENVNHLTLDAESARSVGDAIALLGAEEKGEKHPEKRMKASYTAFEEARLPVLKQEYSNLRLSQLKQMLKKEWMKSPSNPLNKKLLDYNSK